MATKKASLVRVDEDYIDMLMSPYANLSNLAGSPPQQNREIEFHKGKKHHHLPKLPYNTNAPFGFVRSKSSLENSSFPYHTTDASASDQLRRFSSCDANPSEYQFYRDLPKEHWSKKLKHTKSYFWLGQRVNSHRAYIKSLFTKTANCSADKPGVIAANNNVAEKVNKPKCKDFCDEPKINVFENGFANYRGRGSIQRHCVTKASSLSIPSSGSSSSCSPFSGGAQNYEMEGSTEEAIAHCKQSQMQRNGSKGPEAPMALRLGDSRDVPVVRSRSFVDAVSGKKQMNDHGTVAMNGGEVTSSHLAVDMTYNVHGSTTEWLVGGVVATMRETGDDFRLSELLILNGMPTLKAIPLGCSMVLLISSGEGSVMDVIEVNRDWFAVLVSRLDPWSPEMLPRGRSAWLRIYGVPIHAWEEGFFVSLASRFGKVLRLGETTKQKLRMDMGSVQVHLTVAPSIDTVVRAEIDGNLFDIKVVEDLSGRGDPIVKSGSGCVSTLGHLGAMETPSTFGNGLGGPVEVQTEVLGGAPTSHTPLVGPGISLGPGPPSGIKVDERCSSVSSPTSLAPLGPGEVGGGSRRWARRIRGGQKKLVVLGSMGGSFKTMAGVNASRVRSLGRKFPSLPLHPLRLSKCIKPIGSDGFWRKGRRVRHGGGPKNGGPHDPGPSSVSVPGVARVGAPGSRGVAPTATHVGVGGLVIELPFDQSSELGANSDHDIGVLGCNADLCVNKHNPRSGLKKSKRLDSSKRHGLERISGADYILAK